MALNLRLSGIETEAQQLTSLITRTLPVTVASVALWDEPSLTLTVRAVDTVRPLGRSLPVGARAPLTDATWHRIALERSEAVLLQSGDDPRLGFEREAELALIPGVRSTYLLPIRFAEDTVGVLVLGEARAVEREYFSSEKQRRCRVILDEFVAATAHAWEARRLRRQVRAMSSLIELVRRMSTVRSFDDVLVTLGAEVADWLGIPVRGALLGMAGGGVRLLSAWQLPDDILSDGGRQLFLAVTRSGAWGPGPVAVTIVGDDPLDPLAAVEPDAIGWTRITLPLMQRERLLGIVCIYVEDTLRLADWELDAFRRRADIAALGLDTVRTAVAQKAEHESLRQLMSGFFTSYRWTLVQEALGVAVRALPALLPDRLRQALPVLATRPEVAEGEGRRVDDGASLVVDVVSDVLTGLGGRDARGMGSEPMPLEVNEVVERALYIAKIAIDERSGDRGVGVTLRFEPEEGPLLASGSPMLVGAIVHFIESLLETMPDGGEIHVRSTREAEHAKISLSHGGESSDGDQVIGPLLAGGARLHIELGCSIVQALARRHGGDATLSRGLSGGVRLTIRLPLHLEASTGPSSRGLGWRAVATFAPVEHLP
jgi:GAF domain-containing protein